MQLMHNHAIADRHAERSKTGSFLTHTDDRNHTRLARLTWPMRKDNVLPLAQARQVNRRSAA